MGLSRLEQQMQFLIEIDKLKTILRQNYLSDGSRRENDSEHSWHLAMMVVVLSEHFDGLDTLKALKMVLIHDIVEIYAGDTFAYDEKAHLDKEAREIDAAERIFSLLPLKQASEFMELWQEFEKVESKEAMCAAMVDRIQPLTLNICSKGRMWQKHGVTVEKVLKRNKIVLDSAPDNISEYVRSKINEASGKHYFFDSSKGDPFKSDNCSCDNILLSDAGLDDVKILAAMNRELIQDEGSENPMNLEQLEERMKGFLLTEYKAVLISTNEDITGYCLYKIENIKDDGSFDIYVRQYYVKRDFRRKGIGINAFRILTENAFKDACSIKLDVLETNNRGKAFWAKVGFEPYCQNLRLKA